MALNFNSYREQRKFMQIEAEKIILVLLSQQSYIRFSKFSKRTNLELIFNFFYFCKPTWVVRIA